MLRKFYSAGLICLMIAAVSSCKSAKDYQETTVAEEYGLTPVKLTDESQNVVLANRQNISLPGPLNLLPLGGYRDKNFYWETGHKLVVSPDGESLGYVGVVNNGYNIMVKKANANAASTQRTFRNPRDIWWSQDGNLYFNDVTDGNSSINSVNATKGTLVKQLTNNNNDREPIISKNGEILYFTRVDKSGPSIWSYNLKNGELSNCTRGFNPYPYDNKDPYKIVCARNSPKGNTEIWQLDLKEGTETLVLSDPSRGFTDPTVSPDGEWILVVANSLSPITKKQNTDLYAVKMDGTSLTQITYHPGVDCSPVFSPGGQYIYFLSNRATKGNNYCIWRINNPLVENSSRY